MAQIILRRPEVEARCGLARSTIYRLVAVGRFPRPVKVGARACGWLEHEIEEFLDQRAAARPAPTTVA